MRDERTLWVDEDGAEMSLIRYDGGYAEIEVGPTLGRVEVIVVDAAAARTIASRLLTFAADQEAARDLQ